jgi:hypothetical protein
MVPGFVIKLVFFADFGGTIHFGERAQRYYSMPPAIQPKWNEKKIPLI